MPEQPACLLGLFALCFGWTCFAYMPCRDEPDTDMCADKPLSSSLLV